MCHERHAYMHFDRNLGRPVPQLTVCWYLGSSFAVNEPIECCLMYAPASKPVRSDSVTPRGRTAASAHSAVVLPLQLQ